MKSIFSNFIDLIKDESWLYGFAIAVDVIDKLNELNVLRQGKNVFAHEFHVAVRSTQIKLELLSKQLNEN